LTTASHLRRTVTTSCNLRRKATPVPGAVHVRGARALASLVAVRVLQRATATDMESTPIVSRRHLLTDKRSRSSRRLLGSHLTGELLLQDLQRARRRVGQRWASLGVRHKISGHI
jgi:hypothetical protein